MARQVINSNSVQPLGPPNGGLSTEQGDTWDAAVLKMNAMTADLYGGTALVAGGGSATYGAAGNVSKVPGTVTSAGTTSSQTLASYSLPAGTFTAAGQEVEVTAWGVVAANTAPKSIVMNMGGATVTTTTQTGNAYAWWLEGTYMYDGSNVESYLFTGQASGGNVTQKAGTDNQSAASAIALNLVVTDASAATGNVLLLGFTVEFFP
jgi:hypothetical protein